MPPRDPNEFAGADLRQPERAAPASTVDPMIFMGGDLGTPEPGRSEHGDLTKAGAATLGGAALGATGYLARGILRRMFPGMMPKTSALKRLDDEIRRADTSSSLKDMMGEYMRATATAEKPLTFADFMAQQPGHQRSVAAIKELIGNSGNVPAIEEKLIDRASASRQRVLSDVASAMNVTPQSITEGLEKLKSAKMTRAQPLYDEAFKDTNPIRDTRLLDLFGANVPNMAMMNALKARLKTLALQGREAPTLFAADPTRKDAWKRLMTDEVPEQMFAGKEWGKLREYYAPGVEDLHHMRGNLWDEFQKAKASGDNEAAKAYKSSWIGLTKFLDDQTSGAYAKARKAYKGDSDLESAYQTGVDLLTMKPDEIRQAVKGMGADERNALAMGFYGGLADMKQQTFIREFIRRPDLYPERREQLSTVFTDPRRLQRFMDNLEGEQAMSDAVNLYSNPPLSKDPTPRMPYMRIISPSIGGVSDEGMRGYGLQSLQPERFFGWPSRRASRAATDFLFEEPTFHRQSVRHPNWDEIQRTPLSPLEIAKQAGRWSGYSGAGGLGAYGAYRGYDELSDR